MKCIKHTTTQQIRRVSNEEAYAEVAKTKPAINMRGWRYCPKSEWKSGRRNK